MSKAKASASALKFVTIGLNVEYLRGISSTVVQTLNDLQQVPYLLENQPGLRYKASSIVAVIKSLLGELKTAELPKSLEEAEKLRPMLEAVEAVLKESPDPDSVTLLDHFADRIVRIAEDVLKTLREEIA